MRVWLYDRLITDPALEAALEVDLAVPDSVAEYRRRVMPRRARDSVNVPKPFLVYGLGNNTHEELSDSTANDYDANRQFFQVWIHDEDSGSYLVIDDLVEIVKARLHGSSNPANNIITVNWLETSQEFNNETYGTLFRYIRFQAILGHSTGA